VPSFQANLRPAVKAEGIVRVAAFAQSGKKINRKRQISWKKEPIRKRSGLSAELIFGW